MTKTTGKLSVLLHLVFVLFLTVISQVGGIIWLLALLIAGKKKGGRIRRRLAWFCGLYLLANLLLVPMLASQLGRVPLPVLQGSLRPANLLYPLLNRHYMNQASKHALHTALQPYFQNNRRREVHYLDAGFPFLSGFPLFPHLSHTDGRKVDLSFHYRSGMEPTNELPSNSGYGVFEGSVGRETNTATDCKEAGYWQYGYARYLTLGSRNDLQFDGQQTKKLILALLAHPRINKLFIEPHLKARLGLQSQDAIRFHGCQAVRHDDHVHVEFK